MSLCKSADQSLFVLVPFVCFVFYFTYLFYNLQNRFDFFAKNCWYHMTIIDHAALTKSYPERHPFQYNTVNGLKTLKTVPCSAAHTCLGQIRECSPPPWKIFALKLSCNDFHFTARPYPDFFYLTDMCYH